MQLESMYQEIILDHYRNPHHKGLRDPFDAEVHHVNPVCGDEITMRVSLKDVGGEPVVEDVSYDSLGCSISQASASVMSDLVTGKPVEIEPLAKRHPENPAVVERFQIVACGTELGKGFSELNDPDRKSVRERG